MGTWVRLLTQGQTKERCAGAFVCVKYEVKLLQAKIKVKKKEQRDQMPRGTMVGGDSGNRAFLILSLSSLELSKPPFHMQMQHYSKRGQLVHPV